MNPDGSGLRNITRKTTSVQFSGGNWSPDGRRIALSISENSPVEETQIWLVNANDGGRRRLTTGPGSNYDPSLVTRWKENRVHE